MKTLGKNTTRKAAGNYERFGRRQKAGERRKTPRVSVVWKKLKIDPKSYMELIAKFPISPIKDQSHYDQATKALHNVLDRPSRDTGVMSYLAALTDTIEAYENIHYPIKGATPAEIIQFFLEDRGMSQIELGRNTDIATSTISSFVSGARTPTLEHVRRLAAFFHVSPSVFIPTEVAAAK